LADNCVISPKARAGSSTLLRSPGFCSSVSVPLHSKAPVVGRRILLVDDEAALRSLVARAFRERGHEVIEQGDASAALAAVRTTPVPFHLVITNSLSPRAHGPQLLDSLRELDPTLPVIHLSMSRRSRFDHLSEDLRSVFQPFDLWALIDEAEKLMQGPVSQEWDQNSD
jgi:DNA-binding NtrC family response regulator